MNKLLWVSAALMALFVTGESLTCNTCKMGIGGECLISITETCDITHNNCYWGELKFNATGQVSLHTRGCLDSDLCGVTLTGTLLSVGWTSSFQCCNTTLCNGATSVQLSLTVAVCAAVLSSLWGLWE
eukprot:superscaffoldBa00005732_g20721